MRCSPGGKFSRCTGKRSRAESVTPSAASTGDHGPASTEISQRRKTEPRSSASTSISIAAALRRGAEAVTTGGVLSINTGALTRSASRADDAVVDFVADASVLTLMLRTVGGVFWGKYATVTLSTPVPPVNSSFH